MNWACSAASLLMIWLMGKKSKWGPIVGLGSQALWFIYVLSIRDWGLMPSVVGFAIVHGVNAYKWTRPQKFEVLSYGERTGTFVRFGKKRKEGRVMRSVTKAVNWGRAAEIFARGVLLFGGAYVAAHVLLWLVV